MEQAKKIREEISIPSIIIKDIRKEVKNMADFKKFIEKNLKRMTTELVQIILVGALYLDASDIHMETEKKQVKLRIRIDGVLHDILHFDPILYKKLLSRIKLLSKLKLNITTRPQDGRFSILMEETTIEIRTSTLPAEYGETTVMRILNPKNLIDVEALGFREDLVKVFKKEIKKPNGMIIVTGPTGSGKTTTLYAILKKLNKPEVKIITIEDPVEYHLKGISQTQVDPKKGYDFANGLRALMRQDPDVILVGEIRDLETAHIALQAALTGHLVLSTLHTNDAAGTIARFQAIGEKAVNIAPAVNIALAQRLLRRVCKKCVEFKKISPQELTEIKKALRGLPKNIKIPKLTTSTKIPHLKGCKDCNFTGYRGRTGIYEFFLVNDEMEKFILTSPSIVDMRQLAVKKGMVPMRQDGFIKVLKGITTIEEVNRATAE